MAISNVVDVAVGDFDAVTVALGSRTVLAVQQGVGATLGSRSTLTAEVGFASPGIISEDTLSITPDVGYGPTVDTQTFNTPLTTFGPYFEHILEVQVGGIAGKQLATGAEGVGTDNLVDNILSADAAGRAKMAAGYFTLAHAGSVFADGALPLGKLEHPVIRADGNQAMTADLNLGGFKATNAAAPTQDNDLVTKAYADALMTALDIKASCRVATAAALPAYTPAGTGPTRTLTANANGALTVDGVALALNDRVLVKDEGASHVDHGIYYVEQVGDAGNPWILHRASDADNSPGAEVTAGMFTFVTEGTVNADSGWTLITNDPIVLETTPLAFTQFSGAGQIIPGAGLTKTGNQLDVGAGAGIQVNADDVEVIYGPVGEITAIDAGDVASAGVQPKAARSDHEHAVTTGAPTVALDATTTNSEGAGGALARANHGHAISTAAPVNVGTANAIGAGPELSRANHVHASPRPEPQNKNQTPNTTAEAAAQDTGLTIAATPALGGYVFIVVNGTIYNVANGDGERTTSDFYYSGDNGATARAMNAIVAGDKLYHNGDVTGFALDNATDKLSQMYEAFA